MATHTGDALTFTVKKENGKEIAYISFEIPKVKGKYAAVPSAAGKMNMLCSIGWTQYGDIQGKYKDKPLKATIHIGVKA